MDNKDTIQVIGQRADGSAAVIGTAPMPPKMKARELVTEMFSHFEDGDGSDADFAMHCCEQLLEYVGATKFTITPAAAVATQPTTHAEFADRLVRHVSEMDPAADGVPGNVLTVTPKALREAVLIELQDGATFTAQPVQCRLTFGDALAVLKAGGRVCRMGWNGKGMYLRRVGAQDWQFDTPNMGEDEADLGQCAFVVLKDAAGNFIPWNASQADMLAEDWMDVDAA